MWFSRCIRWPAGQPACRTAAGVMDRAVLLALGAGLGLGAALGLGSVLALAAAGAAAASEIRVVVAGPRSGPNADRTRAIFNGAEGAAAALNRQGGIRGTEIKLILKDDACSADRAAQVASEAAAESADLVIGHPCSGAAESAAKIYAAKGVIFIATSSRHPGLTASRAGPSIFRIAGRDDRQAAAAATFLSNHFHGKAIAITHDRTRYARELADEVGRLLAKTEPSAPTVATLVAGEMDFPKVTAKIKDADAIFYAGFPVEAGLLYGELRKAGSRAVVLFSDSVGSAEFVSTFGKDVGDALVLRPRFAVNADTSRVDESLRLTDGDGVNAAAALYAYASAAAQAGALTPDNVRIILDGYALQTPQGVVRFDKAGDGERASYDVVRWSGHSWEMPIEGPSAGPPD